ncbi:MAG: glycosyltransferase family 2 protein [Verrucomicrobia bacterium]|nr:glycosyltransferase family 2 protein [Verrucomicrobiota bacterium]
MGIKYQPLVSAIVPAYNAEPFIRETLDSILSQTYLNLEVIVVDDGSRDATSRIVEEISSVDPRVKLFRQPNSGVAAARNFAISQSNGDYIAPIDADDIWYPAKIEKQVERLEQFSQAGCVYTLSVSIDEKGKLLDAGPAWDLEGEVYQALVFINFVGNASIPMFRKSVLERVGGYNEELRRHNAQGCEDWELCLRVAEKSDFCVVPDYLVGYRCYSESMSYNHEAMGRSYDMVMRDLRERHPEISKELFRWSKGIFYLYLTNKSSVSGDLRKSFDWLLRAIREDAAVLAVPWVPRCLMTRLLRLSAYSITRNPRAWKQLRSTLSAPSPGPTFDEILKTAQVKRPAECLWDRIQTKRWEQITNKRLVTCY